MSNARLEKLLEFIKEQPDDVFLKYALAMEYQGLNDIQKAKEYFEEVVKVEEVVKKDAPKPPQPQKTFSKPYENKPFKKKEEPALPINEDMLKQLADKFKKGL